MKVFTPRRRKSTNFFLKADILKFTSLLLGLLLLGKTAYLQSPGGVSANLKLWLKANTNVTPSTQGANVTGWADQSGGNNNASFVTPLQFVSGNTAVSNPTYQQSVINFNPTVRFPNSSGLQGTFTSAITSNNISAYVVQQMNASTGTYGRVFSISQAPGISDYTNTAGSVLFRRESNTDAIASQRNNFTSTSIASFLNAPVLSSVHFTASNQFLADRNGSAFITNTFTTANFNASYYRTGNGFNNPAEFYNGDIAEVVLYTTDQSSAGTNHNQIESYLAVKYGIHKAGNYVNSSGTTIWDATANAAYDNDVFGIGQDDGSALMQTQSNSMNTGSGTGAGQSGKGNIVISTPSALVNNGFLIIGHNTGDFTFNTSNLPAGLPASYARFNRTWKVAQTGGTGTVTLQFDATGLNMVGGLANVKLLVDADGDGNFATGTTIITPNSVSGNVLTFNNLTLANNYTFTFASVIVSPGGIISNLSLWLKANSNVTPFTQGANVTDWTDQSGGNNNASFVTPLQFVSGNTAVSNPTYQQSVINFNPTVRFPNSSALQGTFTTAITSNNISAYIVQRMNASTGNWGRIFTISQAPGTDDYTNPAGAALFRRQSNTDAIATQRNNFTSTAISSILNIPILSSAHFTASNQFLADRNGSAFSTNTFTTTNLNASYYRLGISFSNTGEFYNGDIAEVVLYTTDQSSTGTNHNQIETYLAVKYGIHKAGNYVNSASTIIWDATANATYHNDVFGIGRDSASGLLQTQSNSMNTGSGNGTGQSGLGNIVISNPSALANNGFMIIGHNTNDFSLINTNMPPGMPTSYGRLNRSWREETTGSVGTVSLSFDVTGIASLASVQLSKARLIIDHDADGNFATGTTASIPVSSIAGNILTFNNVSFSPAVFTLAFELPRLTVSGNVWDDANGNRIKDATEAFTNAGSSLFATLIDKVADTIVASVPVAANGSYSLVGAVPQNTANTYEVIITTSATAHTPGVPASYAFTGQDSAGKAIALPSGILSINTLSANFTNINFGVDQLPVTTAVMLNDVFNSTVFNKTDHAGYLGANLSNAALQPLSGTDPEDCPGGCSQTRTFRIDAINANTLLFYNGAPVIAGATISNFDVALLSIYGTLGSGTAADPIGFDYSLIDAAGKASAAPAQYRITTVFPLPVTLTSFTVQKTDCNSAWLKWTVANASNFSHFEVERSTDGISFTKFTTIPYRENQTGYEWKQADLADGHYLYRLKLVDRDGSYKLSPIVNVPVSCGLTGIVILPNPAKDNINIKGISTRADVRILNAQGQVVINVQRISDMQSIDISRLPAATYVVQVIKDGTIIANSKIVKE